MEANLINPKSTRDVTVSLYTQSVQRSLGPMLVYVRLYLQHRPLLTIHSLQLLGPGRSKGTRMAGGRLDIHAARLHTID